MSEIVKKITEYVNEAGGRVFYVGGCVRDRLLGIDNKDVDIEVHGISPEDLYSILEKVGEPLAYGKSFGVFALRGEDIDIAMPRRERAVGKGHRDFVVDVDPFIGTREAARRRDFTINALMENAMTGEIVDHFGGQEDLKAGIIRHIDPATFVEDPLRVLRGAQFAARFGFGIAPDTVELCRGIDLSTLSKERVEEELRKALLKADKPSIFFEAMREMDQLDHWFPELKELIGLEQDPVFHPEGDVWTHTMEVIDRAAGYRDKVSEPFSFMLLALTHDLGKIVTTEEKNGRIHAYEHETKGLPLVESFLRRILNENDVIDYVLNMVPLHMKPNVAAHSKPALKSTNRMFDQAEAPEDLIWFAASDRPVFAGEEAFSGDTEFLLERLAAYDEIMAKPHVMGRDLIAAGLEPGEDFSEILEYAHKLRLAGIEKDLAMKQVLAYARDLKKRP
ncbi:MAG: HD domain-containing protein [Firmicutes bacterium]|nr:HD domain-containing protein [Bacillota bacterium]MBR3375807.1 HD domain-containing protein [Bacillota bacterium]MBR4024806.1 HD domain-containing protein [Bacillota bacterium]